MRMEVTPLHRKLPGTGLLTQTNEGTVVELAKNEC